MHFADDRFGHKNAVLMFDSREEEKASVEAFLKGEYWKITSAEVLLWRESQEDMIHEHE